MKTKNELWKELNDMLANRHPDIRKGQAIFNYIDAKYGVARKVQPFVDCFYLDKNIDLFVEQSLDYINGDYVTTEEAIEILEKEFDCERL